jgi:hypothetical protein
MQTNKGKEFLNIQTMLKHEKIQFQVCRNPDVKCAIVERVQRTLRDKLFKYFTYSNSHRYLDVLLKFVRAYNNTVHRSTGMAPSKVTDSDVLAIWKRLKQKRSTIRTAKPRLRVGQHVRISKVKMRFAKSGEQNYTTEIFKIKKVIYRTPRPVYELEDLNETLIGQFYGEEPSPVRISESTEYKIDKILDKRVRAGIRKLFVRWKAYSKAYDSWVPASSVRNI